ncbi:hypothetical protein [Cognatiyoonia sediminum]|uniref:hypothetical protein n=1 Tax=Cognatiyoonia sediminum TaxID=1508389 RepID=UPI0009321E5E|nr:hypothetical protein [Cognatiyoonia sediminum]
MLLIMLQVTAQRRRQNEGLPVPFFKVLLLGLLSLVGGCTDLISTKVINPYPDEPERHMRISTSLRAISGVAWSLEQDGSFVSFGGPLGGKIDFPLSRVILISNTGITLETASDTFREATKVQTLHDEAEAYCGEIGYIRKEIGGSYVGTKNGDLFFVDLCEPE